MLRVIFDRSAFHGERFSLISTSRLQTCCRKRKLSVAHTPIFLEETLRMYGGRQRKQLRQQMPFILDICNGGIYHDTKTIWERELIFNHGTSTNVFRFKRDQIILEQNIQKGVLKENWSDWNPSLWDDIETNKKSMHAFYREFRSETLRKRSFNDYLKQYIDITGRYIIQRLIEAENNEYLQDKWSKNKEYYPFITAFVKGAVFAEYYSVFEKNKKLDKNAETDWLLMTYLNRADILVSADMNFQHSAFVELWEPHGKKFMTPVEFVNFIEAL